MSVSYFQVGGFHPQIQWFKSTYDNRQLAECIAGPASLLRSQTNPDEPVELVLGIKRSGSSHLLLTADKAYQLSRALRLPDPRSPFRANEFESLSPIHFASAEALSKKLSELKPKAGARGDTSQANRGYDEFQDDLYRAAFEHGRVIYRVLNETIDAQTYGLDDTSWSQNLRISAMVFNTKGLDDRRTEERIKNPLVLDVGFCDAESPTLEPDARKTSHIINAANSLLGRKQRKLPFVHGNTETVPGSEMPTRIQALFKNHVHPTDQPMILLVYKEVETMNYLRNMGVDISSWRFGLGDLLVMDRSTRREHSPYRRDSRRFDSSRDTGSSSTSSRNHSESRYPLSRSRSRSPARSKDPRLDLNNSPSHRRSISQQNAENSAPKRKLYPPVHVLDIQQLYVRLMKAEYATSIVEIARSFGLTEAEGWCAGNEATLAIDIWRSMVSGLSIDEQRVVREARSGQHPQPRVNTVADQPKAAYDSDDERDPNDIVQASAPAPAPAAQTSYNFDVSDYGDSDSDDD